MTEEELEFLEWLANVRGTGLCQEEDVNIVPESKYDQEIEQDPR